MPGIPNGPETSKRKPEDAEPPKNEESGSKKKKPNKTRRRRGSSSPSSSDSDGGNYDWRYGRRTPPSPFMPRRSHTPTVEEMLAEARGDNLRGPSPLMGTPNILSVIPYRGSHPYVRAFETMFETENIVELQVVTSNQERPHDNMVYFEGHGGILLPSRADLDRMFQDGNHIELQVINPNEDSGDVPGFL